MEASSHSAAGSSREETVQVFLSHHPSPNDPSDRVWALWLQREIARYQIPEDLVGTRSARGDTVPSRLSPVLPHMGDGPGANHDSALDRSRFLIVLCSPLAAASPEVARDVLRFKRRGRATSILAVLVPDNSSPSLPASAAWFPPPLLHPLDESGEPDRFHHLEPATVDLRPPLICGSDPSPAAVQQSLERATNFRPNRIRAEMERHEQRLRRSVHTIAAALLGVPEETLRAHDRLDQLERSRERIRRSRNRLAALAALSLLLPATLTLTHLAESRHPSPGPLLALGSELSREGFAALEANRPEDARAHFEAALEVSGRLREIDPGSPHFIFTQSLALEQLGQLALSQSRDAEALVCFTRSLELRLELVRQEPADLEHRAALARACRFVGRTQQFLGRLEESAAAFRSGAELHEILLASGPSPPGWLENLATISFELGQTLRLLEDSSAREAFDRALLCRRQLAATSPPHPHLEAIAEILRQLGELSLEAGDLAAARSSFILAAESAENLVALHPENPTYYEDLRFASLSLSRISRQLGEMNQAYQFQKRALRASQALLRIDPENPLLIRDLASHEGYLAAAALGLNQPDLARAHADATLAFVQQLENSGALQEGDRALAAFMQRIRDDEIP